MNETNQLKRKNIIVFIALIFTYSTVKLFSQSNTYTWPKSKGYQSKEAMVLTMDDNSTYTKNQNFYVTHGSRSNWFHRIKFEVQMEGGAGTRSGMFMDTSNLYLVADWDNNSDSEDIVFGFNSNAWSIVDEKMRLTDEGFLGIGTNSPKKKLHVNGDIYAKGHVFLHAFEGDRKDGTAYIQARDDSNSTSVGLQLRSQNEGKLVDAFKINPDGNIGIGIVDPQVKLDVSGSVKISGNSTSNDDGNLEVSGDLTISGNTNLTEEVNLDKGITVKGNISSLGTLDVKSQINFSNVLNSQQVLVNKGVDFRLSNIENSHFSIKNAFGNNALYVKTDGKMGFGAINPNNITEQLHVAGRIKASGFIADASSFPDYVFAKDYKLMPLKEVKNYTDKNKHLPGMPSEKEVVKNGLDIKKVVTISVEKIEELYLHTIQQEKEINDLKKMVSELQKQLKIIQNNN